MSRNVESLQMELGQLPITNMTFNLKSRDDIPKILKGLQYIYMMPSVREPIFKLLEEKVLPDVDKTVGRPGMVLWNVLVLGILRLDLNCDYDRLHELANEHNAIRKMLGHSEFFEDDKEQYSLQRIKDNVRLLTPELLEEINHIVVKAGHGLLDKKKESEALRGRCDSFVVETDVHFPADINLLYDATRKVIQLSAQLAKRHEVSGWRQSSHNVKLVKRKMRAAQKRKQISGKTEQQKVENEKKLKQSHQELINASIRFLNKSEETIAQIKAKSVSVTDLALLESIQPFSNHAKRQIAQIERRVLQGEVIPHEEKVFSIFEPHTEWVAKGKAGVPVELGLRVCVLEDQHQFILHHRVMVKEIDVDVAVSMLEATQAQFPNLRSCSYDKAFHSKENQEALKTKLDTVGLKRKGKLSKAAKEIESSEAFKKAIHKHSAVESAINALEVHGLDKCRDHGLDGFKRYVSLAIVTRNIHRIGDILFKKAQKKLARQKNRCRDGTEDLPLAA